MSWEFNTQRPNNWVRTPVEIYKRRIFSFYRFRFDFNLQHSIIHLLTKSTTIVGTDAFIN